MITDKLNKRYSQKKKVSQQLNKSNISVLMNGSNGYRNHGSL